MKTRNLPSLSKTSPGENPRRPVVAAVERAFVAAASAGGSVEVDLIDGKLLASIAGDDWSTGCQLLDPDRPGAAFAHVVEDLNRLKRP